MICLGTGAAVAAEKAAHVATKAAEDAKAVRELFI